MQRVPLKDNVAWVAHQRGYQLRPVGPREFSLCRQHKVLLPHASLAMIAEYISLRVADDQLAKNSSLHLRAMRPPRDR